MNTPNLFVIVGSQLRHQYFVNQLNFYFPLCAVFVEHFEHPKPIFEKNTDRESWHKFFLHRRKTEEQFLSLSNRISARNNPPIVKVEKGQLNHNQTLQVVESFNPTKIFIFGTSLVDSKYLELYPNCIFNLHVGLSQYYRGSSCNFWPIYDLRPDLLGATIHHVRHGIDDGEIISQDTIELEESDSEYTLMVKTVILGTKLMVDSINMLNENLLIKKEQNTNGKLYLMNQLTPRAVIKVRNLVISGGLKKQIAAENENRMKSISVRSARK